MAFANPPPSQDQEPIIANTYQALYTADQVPQTRMQHPNRNTPLSQTACGKHIASRNPDTIWYVDDDSVAGDSFLTPNSSILRILEAPLCSM